MKQMTESARQLATENMLLVPYTLRMCFGCSGELDDDVLSEGYIGLCKAASSYNPDSGVQFSTYAIKCIKTEIRYIGRLNRFKKRQLPIPLVSLNTVVRNEDGDISELIDLVIDENENTEEAAIDHILLQSVVPMMPITSAMDVFNYMSTEIAEHMGVSKQWVSFMHRRELKNAERNLLKNGIIDRETIEMRKKGA